MSHHQAQTSRPIVFTVFVLQFFRAIALAMPFALQTRVTVYMVLGRGVVGICVWCPLLFIFGGWRGFALVKLQVALVFGYGKGSCHLDFCRDVGLPDQQRVRGLGLRPFVVYPPSCRGGRFYTLVV